MIVSLNNQILGEIIIIPPEQQSGSCIYLSWQGSKVPFSAEDTGKYFLKKGDQLWYLNIEPSSPGLPI